MMKTPVLTLLIVCLTLPVWALDLRPPLDEYWVSSQSGYRDDPMGGQEESRLHKGLDLVGPPGSLVRAVGAGVVVEHWSAPNGYYKGHPIYGGSVVIDHLEGTYTLYDLLSRTFIREGDKVEQGAVIGLLQGSTGEHLHFEVIVNPLSYLGPGDLSEPDGTDR